MQERRARDADDIASVARAVPLQFKSGDSTFRQDPRSTTYGVCTRKNESGLGSDSQKPLGKLLSITSCPEQCHGHLMRT
ncbi:MAG: hypothetical protein AB7P11_05245 [Hydrogenophaga sp.]|uniref:hypothetical protein n=1 Tax=Hydrogenophaga sp. TaxID=1904254 RepID=UPI003D1124AA